MVLDKTIVLMEYKYRMDLNPHPGIYLKVQTQQILVKQSYFLEIFC